MRYNLVLLTLCLLFCIGCYDEDTLTPTTISELTYTLPQGDHDFDKDIVDWNKRCGFFFLYKFEPRDVYWNWTGWQELLEKPDQEGYISNASQCVIEETREDLVGEWLGFIENKLFKLYPDTVLRRCMPIKFILSGRYAALDWFNVLKDNALGVRLGADYIMLNNENKKLEEFTSRKKELVKDTLNLVFLRLQISKGRIYIPDAFGQVSVYSTSASSVTTANMYSQGFIKTYTNTAVASDWDVYLAAVVKTPYNELIEEPEDGDYSFRGILHSKKDVNGLIREKYNILINHFKENYNIDIQAIGNAQEH